MKLGRTVGELLDSTTSHELAEWQAYERVAGPIDQSWRDESFAQLIDDFRHMMYMFSEANFSDSKKGKKGPVDKPGQPFPRPYDVYKQSTD